MLSAQPPPPPEVVGKDESSCRDIFVEFMTKVAQFEELAESGERLLGRFREELVKTLLEELECLVENVYGITLTASLSALEVDDSQCLDNMPSTDCCFMEGVSTQEEDKSADQLDTDVPYVTVMVMVCNMLKLDYAMQEKIVSALSLKTPSSELEGYHLMWDLRPYIDDNVMRFAWKMCP